MIYTLKKPLSNPQPGDPEKFEVREPCVLDIRRARKRAGGEVGADFADYLLEVVCDLTPEQYCRLRFADMAALQKVLEGFLDADAQANAT
jgi:hypothetical protein